MLSLSLLFMFVVMVYYLVVQTERQTTPVSQKVTLRLERLWTIAQTGMREKKYLRAEKALLTILKLDQTNASAYNRLGILYSRQKEFKDAIECFEIASSIKPSASSLHNLGLIYFETENYPKAALAFEHAIELEGDLAARHIAYAKVQEKLNNYEQVIESLIEATKLEPTKQTYKMLEDAYKLVGDSESAKQTSKKATKLTSAKKTAKRTIRRPRRIVH